LYVGLLSKAACRIKRFWNTHDPHTTASRLKICRVEELETRAMMAADVPNINVGVFYYEADGGQDSNGDRLEITFNGGAPGTQLTHLVIDTDKDGLGLSLGDAFFDTAAGGLGASLAFPLTIVDQTGITQVLATVTDGGTKLVLDFTGFDVGEKLVLNIDVDEKGFSANSSNAVVEGEEFEGSKLFATFSAPHFFDTSTSTEDPPRFFDEFSFAGLGLNLPPDGYIPPGTTGEQPVRTAGVFATLTPVPLPITISGTVYNDVNLNNVREPGDAGIGGVAVSLWEFNGSTYVATGKSVVTDANGNYAIDGVLPGQYRLVETQPGQYFSVGATAGSVNGAINGSVTSVDVISDITLLGGQDSVHNDFAESLPVSLSGHVYHDADQDGIGDPGEEPIGGVTITLERLASTNPQLGPTTTTVVTDANGFWSASGLMAGTYVVRETQPAGYYDGLDRAGTAGGTAVNPGDEINSVFLPSGANGENYDFGELKPVKISGLVHTDTDFDCILDPNELPLSGVTVFLLDAAGNRIASTTTDANGHYEFTNLAPGTYGLEENQPAGYYDGGDKLGSHGGTSPANDKFAGITIGSGQSATEYNFCEHPPAQLSGRVYIDDNDNGAIDAGESGIGGVTLELLDANGNPTGETTTTLADGSYSFANLAPGVYGVAELQPAGYYDGRDSAGTAGGAAVNPGDRISGATLAPASHGQQYNFGELRPASISGRVHRDENGNCILDPGEQPLSGVTIFLLDAGGTRIASTLTDANGVYKFDNLPPGTYGVEEVQPAGVFDGGEKLGSVGGIVAGNDLLTNITVGSGVDAINYDFCEHAPVSIAGRVYVDDNNNGAIDAGEVGIGGATLTLLDAAGNATGVTTATAADGSYKFDGLAPGVYGVAEVQPAGYYDGLDTAGTAGGAALNPGDRITGATLNPGVYGAGYNFGELRPTSISGRVHADVNGNCEFDPGEAGIAGVTILLLDANGTTLQTTQTAADGTYSFTNLAPGTYGVRELQPAGYFDGGQQIGSAGGVASANDETTGIALVSGQNGVDYDFCEKPPATLGGMVHVDLNGNCLLDPNETPLAGVTIYLLDAAGNRVASTTTDAFGRYIFTGLAPNQSYGVEELQPAGYFDGDETLGSHGGVKSANDRMTEILVGPGQDATEYNFCELPPASISGRVHVDQDGDCILDPDETPLAGVTIWLLDANGQRVRSTTTNAAGQYIFTDLAPNQTYGVEEIQPGGVYDGNEHVGTAGGLIAGNDRITGIVPAPGQAAVDYNFCELPPASFRGKVFADADGDCIFDVGERPLVGVTIYLLDSSGVRIGSTTTDANGEYVFAGLAPNIAYGVEEVQPAGVFDGDEMVGSAGGIITANDRMEQIILVPGENAFGYDFCEHEPVSIAGRVYVDANNNGQLDTTEPGIGGTSLMLLDAAGNPTGITTTTDAQGFYRFTGLAPGVYGVSETQPAGYFDGSDTVGSAGGVAMTPGDRITGANLLPGVYGVNYNFGELLPAEISGYVFRDGARIVLPADSNLLPQDVERMRNGLRTPDDTPIAGAVLQLGDSAGELLRDANGNPITAVTDANGFYRFTGLEPGTYSIFQRQPGGFDDGVDTPGTAGGLAANPSNELNPLLLAIDHGNDAIVLVTVAAGAVSRENNFSEVQTTPPVPIIPFLPPPERTPDPVPPPIVGYVLPPPVLIPAPPPAPLIIQNTFFGGSAAVTPGYSWHLSIIDAGHPRGERTPAGGLVQVAESRFDVFGGVAQQMTQSRWKLKIDGQAEPRDVIFGMADAIPISGDFNGDGISEVGVFRHGQWYIDINGNGIWDAEDLWAELGSAGDLPVTGDWDGDGKTDIGIFGPSWPNDQRAVAAEPGLPDPENRPSGAHKNVPPKPADAAAGYRKLKLTAGGRARADLVDHVFYFGHDEDHPVVGDWNGDGVDTIGIFHDGMWVLDDNGDGQWLPGESMAEFGRPGDIPIVGDFNGDGIDELAVYRDGTWYIDTNNNRQLDAQDAVIHYGGPNDRPVVGDWDGDGRDEIGLYQDGANLRPAS
jgi:protocatechuate 3,4-dioxygenase beta subunit